MLAGGHSDLTAEGIMNLLPKPAATPLVEIVADGSFRGEVMR